MKPKKTLILMTLVSLIVFLLAGCSDAEGFQVKEYNIVENNNNHEIWGSVVNNGDPKNCSIDIIVSNEEGIVSTRTIYFGIVENGKLLNFKDNIDFPQGNSSIDVRGYCR
ncbi:MAG: hypothetical protein Q8O89_07965 [Nanoarchaeota archaeon]|nr:hypothetical protein [Nanoarchaeota archaeon]